MEVLKYKRGQIWWYRTGDNFNGSIQGKTRPVIIMSNDAANKNSGCLLAIPCTSAEKKKMYTHTSFYIDNILSTALAENMLSINKDKLGDYIGSVDDELLAQLEFNVRVALGLEQIPNESVEKLGQMEPEDKTMSLSDNISPVRTVYEERLKATVVRKKYGKMSEEDKHRFLKDYENHDNAYMLKKYNIKDSKNLQQKVYMIRKEFGLGVRNR